MRRKSPPRPAAPAAAVALEIEKLVYGGDGLARHDGVTYFVPFVLAGESIRARPVDQRRNFVRAKLEEFLRVSPERVAPLCPYFTACGGCHYQHIPYPRQLEVKRDIVRETFARLGRLNWDGPVTLHGSEPFGYRNRAQWKVRPQPPRAAGTRGGLALGYFRAGSNQLCVVDECPVLAPPLAAALETFRATLRSGALPESLREIEVFAEPSGSLLVNLTFSALPDGPRRVAERVRAAIPAARSVLLRDTEGERMELDGPGHLSYHARGTDYRVGHLSFFQVNRYLIEPMIEAVTSGPAQGLALDLFAGVGLFSVPLGKRFERVVAVEADPAAARDLEANLNAAGATAPRTIGAVNAEVARFLADWRETPDLVVLDPPRLGVPAEAIAALAKLRPGRILYVSCDPATLARDLRALAEAGFEIAELHLFDMFPQTYHIETLVHLTPKP
ncbi:MAG TPA: class I SAM-dependent RNA methyltransferase [Candidatus Acidoferrales bacterium]|nr:class I SAM-dependent RNA methyltransferase [Candidatus Acidoferrales bacterium]